MISNKKDVLAVMGRSLEEILPNNTHAESNNHYTEPAKVAAKYPDSSSDREGAGANQVVFLFWC